MLTLIELRRRLRTPLDFQRFFNVFREQRHDERSASPDSPTWSRPTGRRPSPRRFGSGGFRERDADGPATADRSRRGRRSAQADFDDTAVSTHLIETGIDGLQLLPVGLHRDNPSELFDSPGMQPVLDQLHLLADVILLDTPPVLSTPDTAILASLTHGAIIVASEGRTDRADLERTAHRLESTGCRIVGLVLNHVRRTTSDGYQAYGYGA